MPDGQTIDPDTTYAPRDAAERLAVDYRIVRQAIQAGRLAATMEGGRWVIAPADLDAWRRR